MPINWTLNSRHMNSNPCCISVLRLSASQQSVLDERQDDMHWTGGIRRHFRAFFWLRVYTAPRQSPRSPGRRKRQPLGNQEQKQNRLWFASLILSVSLKKQIHFLGLVNFFSGGIGWLLSFFVHFNSGFQPSHCIIRFCFSGNTHSWLNEIVKFGSVSSVNVLDRS